MYIQSSDYPSIGSHDGAVCDAIHKSINRGCEVTLHCKDGEQMDEACAYIFEMEETETETETDGHTMVYTGRLHTQEGTPEFTVVITTAH